MNKSAGHFLWVLLVLRTAQAQDALPPDPAVAEHALSVAQELVRARLNAESRAGLDTAQSAWEAFRAAECIFRTQWTEGGSVRPQLLQLCRARLAEERVAQLKYFLECEEGDLTCPPPP